MLNMCSCMYSLMWLQLFNLFVYIVHTSHPHMVDPDFTTLELWTFCFLCMGLLCVEYQTGLHSPALRSGYDELRRLYGIPTFPTLCDPFCSHGAILMCGHT